MLLLLDWRKAFDRVCPKAMIVALRRFGLPEEMLQLVDSIYRQRRFRVQEEGSTSTWKDQSSGIAQGCPLSPFLFSILMTVIIHDVFKALQAENPIPSRSTYINVADIMYADDTMLIHDDPEILQKMLHGVVETGRQYGLEMNWDKVELLRVRGDGRVEGPGGEPVKLAKQAVYLGALVSADGRIGGELNRRIGQASATFSALQRVWKHTRLPRSRKQRIYHACVLPVLLYSLETGCLTKADRQRVDGFHARCLRRIYGIAPAFYSRISNAAVMQISGDKPLSESILERQLKYFWTLAHSPDCHPVMS